MKTLCHNFVNSWDVYCKFLILKVLFVYFWKYQAMSEQNQLYVFESNGCFFGYLCMWKINFIPRLILKILDFHEFYNLTGQEHTLMCLITFNWNLWKNLLFLWISIRRHLKLTYHFEVLWACTQCFNSFTKYWTSRNPTIWSVKRIFDNKRKSKNFVWQGI